MSKYKVGDFVSIRCRLGARAKENYRAEFPSGGFVWVNESCIQDEPKTYEDGLNDAWELARKLYNLDCNTLEDIYGVDGGFYGLMKEYTAQEAIAKLEAYEKSQQIQVGDVVECFSDYKGVVLDSISEQIDVFTENGCVECLVTNDVKKTNKHLDIEHLLEQIRGNE